MKERKHLEWCVTVAMEKLHSHNSNCLRVKCYFGALWNTARTTHLDKDIIGEKEPIVLGCRVMRMSTLTVKNEYAT